MEDVKFVVWKEEYSVGLKSLDTQHIRMFNLINRLYQAMQRGLKLADLRQILQEMDEYRGVHFAQEERIMKECGYPDLALHQESHSSYQKKLGNMVYQFQAGQTDLLSFDLLQFLKEWWTAHILSMDQGYAPYITAEIWKKDSKNL